MNPQNEAVKKTGNRTSVCGALLGAAATAPSWTAAAVLSLLGLAGSTAATVSGFLAPLLAGLSAALLARAHYLLYFRRRGGRVTAAVTWLATAGVAGFWIWKWLQ